MVDTSALIAILLKEDEAEPFIELIHDMKRPRISTASLFETLLVLAGRTKVDNAARVNRFLVGAGLEAEPVTLRQVDLANRAFLAFGKGRHPAALNFGDCFAYALAKSLDLPLLFKGDDFRRTDIHSVL